MLTKTCAKYKHNRMEVAVLNWPGILSVMWAFCPGTTSSDACTWSVEVSRTRPDGWPPTFTINGLPINVPSKQVDLFVQHNVLCLQYQYNYSAQVAEPTLPLTLGDQDPCLTQCSLGLQASSSQTGRGSVQSFLHSRTHDTDRLTDAGIIDRNSPHWMRPNSNSIYDLTTPICANDRLLAQF